MGGRDLKHHLVPTSCHGQGHFPLAQAAPTWFGTLPGMGQPLLLQMLKDFLGSRRDTKAIECLNKSLHGNMGECNSLSLPAKWFLRLRGHNESPQQIRNIKREIKEFNWCLRSHLSKMTFGYWQQQCLRKHRWYQPSARILPSPIHQPQEFAGLDGRSCLRLMQMNHPHKPEAPPHAGIEI